MEFRIRSSLNEVCKSVLIESNRFTSLEVSTRIYPIFLQSNGMQLMFSSDSVNLVQDVLFHQALLVHVSLGLVVIIQFCFSH